MGSLKYVKKCQLKLKNLKRPKYESPTKLFCNNHKIVLSGKSKIYMAKSYQKYIYKYIKIIGAVL